jgi:hypothetical protein
MQSSLESMKIVACVWPSELQGTSLGAGAGAVCDLDELIAQIQDEENLIWVVYPLLSQTELNQPERVDEWTNFYRPLVALHNRGVSNLVFKAKDSLIDSTQTPLGAVDLSDPLLLKLGSQLFPDAFETQDQLELLASGLNRDPVFAPTNLEYTSLELLRLIKAFSCSQSPVQPAVDHVVAAHNLHDSLYKQKSELMQAQLSLLQGEFARLNDELNCLREESLLTADLIFKAGDRLLKS